MPSRACALIGPRTAISTPIRPGKRRPARTCRPFKKAEQGALVLLSQDAARFSMIPTLRTTLGLKGHRPIVGNVDGHAVVPVFGALNLVTGRLPTRLTARHRPTAKPSRPMQQAFARHVRDIARAYSMAQSPRVVLMIDNAPGTRAPRSQQLSTPHRISNCTACPAIVQSSR